MISQSPARAAYDLPTSGELGAAVAEALEAVTAAHAQLGRVMAVVTASCVRDILTGCRPGLPFDAVSVELAEGRDGSLFPTGRYWTAAGDERLFSQDIGEIDAANALHDMSGWTAYLDDATRDVWHPLCTRLADRDGQPVYALDLTRAAGLLPPQS
ncbi:hypothetical protein [Streptomyces rubradiris]|uniref:hypothetical protein n=1 Tax=Streptomyces rubradiris TaxID=285531 RepID=UPI0016758541|nr:hypothetical protein [Streptomyces rubradiris]GHH25620.1 hypothetical protein GCM10018792_64820 [Streptomyces rubradiris]